MFLDLLFGAAVADPEDLERVVHNAFDGKRRVGYSNAQEGEERPPQRDQDDPAGAGRRSARGLCFRMGLLDMPRPWGDGSQGAWA